MDAHPASHPTDQTLSSFGLGKLDDGSAEAVNQHLEQCGSCRQRVAEMSADSFLQRIRVAQKPSGNSIMGESPPSGTKSYKANNDPASPPANTLPPGLADHPDYEIKRELGRGGMGVVYLAHNKLMSRDEVLKVMGRHIMERPGILDRFLREIRAVAKLRHANIVTAYHAARLGESIVFAMEYVEGYDLAQLVKGSGPLPVALACNFVYQAALGLQHAHEEGLVHRDIKPGNLMLARKGDKAIVKVLDFGLAKATREQKADSALTSEGQAIGTPDFIAPEQILDAASADIRADIYSLGGTLYYLLTGRPPFTGNALYDIYQAHISQVADPLNLVRPEVPVELAALVAKMMAKEPARRFQTPGEVAQALTPFFKKGKVAFKVPKVDVLEASQPSIGQPAAMPVAVRARRATDAASPDPPAKKAVVPAVPEVRWESLIELREAESPIEATPSVAPPRRPPWVWPAVAAGLLMIGFVAAWLGGGLRVKTPDGVIVLENYSDDCQVFVDKNRVTVSWAVGAKPAQIEIPPGEYRVRVTRGDEELLAEEVILKSGRKKILTVRREGPDALGFSRNDKDEAAGDRGDLKKVEEANPWPGALPLAGQRFPQGSRFLAMSHDCRRLAALSATGNVRVIEASGVRDGVVVKGQPQDEHGKPLFVWGADFSPDGKYLAVACNDCNVRFWDTSTGEEVCQFIGRAISVACSSDGKRLAGADRQDKHVKVWDTTTRKKLVELGPHSVVTICAAFSPDGTRLASGGGPWPSDSYEEKFGLGVELKVWDLETGTGSVLEGHPQRVSGVAFSPDGRRLASASADKTVKVWDLATRKCLVTFGKHQVPVHSVRFSPDGRLMASIGAEIPVRVWDSATGREVAILTGLPGHPDFVQFSPEGRWIYSGGGDTLKAWKAPSDVGPRLSVSAGLSTASSSQPASAADGKDGLSTDAGGTGNVVDSKSSVPPTAGSAPDLKLLIITGDHGHAWKDTTKVLSDFLGAGGQIKIDVTTTPSKDLTDAKLAKYDVLLLNYKDTPNGAPDTRWSRTNKQAFLTAIRDGKGLVVFHHASSAFTKPNWNEFEKAIAGGWRSQAYHGPKHVFTVKTADIKHPISEGLPAQFEHAIDELYQNSVMVPGSVVLATAYSDPAKPRGTGKDEPVIWVNRYGKGRVYHNVLGHDAVAMVDPSFQEWMRRGVIWAGTQTPTVDSEEGWVSLFNGKDLTGWKNALPDNGSKWEVTADGTLEGHGGGELGKPAILVSESRKLTNLLLRVTVRFRTDSGGGRIAIRHTSPDDDRPNMSGYHIKAGGPRNQPIGSIGMGLTDLSAAWDRMGDPKAFVVDQWHTIEITAIKNRITTRVDEEGALDFVDVTAKYPAGGVGVICGWNAQIQIKEILIKELPDDSDPPQSARQRARNSKN